MISVVVADHEIVRRGIAAVFRSETDLRIVGETADGVEALRLVERLRPDVLVVDGQLPGVNGFEVARQALRASKKTRIVIIGMQQHEAYVRRALKTGALGYVLKSMRPRDIVDAYDKALRNKEAKADILSMLWDTFGEKTVLVMADGSQLLACLWESAWEQGHGDSQLKDISASSQDDLVALYDRKTFLTSYTLPHIDPHLKR